MEQTKDNTVQTKNAFLDTNTFYFLVGGLGGVLIFILMYGVQRLSFTNIEWIYDINGDLLQHYLGWELYRNGDWQFPLGLTDTMAYPNSISVLYTDSIPFLAIFFKLFRGVLPEHFQYLGAYGLLCFALQGGMGSIIMKRFTSSRFLNILGTIIIILSPVMIYRMYYHTALASHFLVLFAVYLWFCCDEISFKRAIISWTVLGVLCSGIMIYFLPIVGLITVAFAIKQAITRAYPWYQCVLIVVAYCASALLTIWILGGFYGDFELTAHGFGVYSANLNTLYNSMGIGSLLPCIRTQFGQEEGLGYLGFGVIVLALVAITFTIICKCQKKALITDKHYTIAMVVSTLWLLITSIILAVGPNIYWNHHLLFSYTLPNFLHEILSIVRSSGRFIWITVYVIEFYAFRYVFKIQKEQIIVNVMAIACFLQILDMCQCFFQKTYTPEPSPLQAEEWNLLAQDHDKIILMDIFVNSDLYIFADYAYQNDMKLSQYRFSRSLETTIKDNIEANENEIKAGNIDPDAIYVFTDSTRPTNTDFTFYELNGYIVGVYE
ncbi:MAG: hypothetical protein IJ040_01930 [Lachnospiraceae bacterium]|nr:hypothetical protein [Lachnospiraceae bacterium]